MEEVKKEAEVVGFNKNRIVLTNGEVMALMQEMRTPDGNILMSASRVAFNKMRASLSTSGKPYYWVYRVWKEVIKLGKAAEEDRVEIAKEYCDKNTDGTLAFVDAVYQFEPEQQKLYDVEIKEISTSLDGSSITFSNDKAKEIAEKYCKRDKDGKPIKVGGNNLKFSENNIKAFNDAFQALLDSENILPFDKITINSDLLAEINSKTDKPVTTDDMLMLDKIFLFEE